MRVRLPLALMVAALLTASGCVTTAPEKAWGVRGTPEGAVLDLPTCEEVALLLFVDKARAQAMLPEGFVAGDASRVLGGEDSLGQGLVEIVVASCGSVGGSAPLAFAGFYVLVDEPDAAERTPERANLSLYAPYLYAAEDLVGAAHARGGMPVTSARVSLEQVLVKGAPAWVAHVEDAEGELFSMVALVDDGASEPQAINFTNRAWRATDEGLAYVTYRTLQADSDLGAVASCTVRPDSGLATTLGTTSCAGERALAALVTDLHWQLTIATLPAEAIREGAAAEAIGSWM